MEVYSIGKITCSYVDTTSWDFYGCGMGGGNYALSTLWRWWRLVHLQFVHDGRHVRPPDDNVYNVFVDHMHIEVANRQVASLQYVE